MVKIALSKGFENDSRLGDAQVLSVASAIAGEAAVGRSRRRPGRTKGKPQRTAALFV